MGRPLHLSNTIYAPESHFQAFCKNNLASHNGVYLHVMFRFPTMLWPSRLFAHYNYTHMQHHAIVCNPSHVYKFFFEGYCSRTKAKLELYKTSFEDSGKIAEQEQSILKV